MKFLINCCWARVAILLLCFHYLEQESVVGSDNNFLMLLKKTYLPSIDVNSSYKAVKYPPIT